MALKPFAVSAVQMGKSQYLSGGRFVVRLSLQVDNSLALRKIESLPLGFGGEKEGSKGGDQTKKSEQPQFKSLLCQPPLQ